MHTLEPCDFVVVGAGFTGALLARRLADEDLRVTVLEATDTTGGNSLWSMGLALLGTPEPYAALVERLGEETAAQIWLLTQQSLERLSATAQRLNQPVSHVGSFRLTDQDDEAALLQRSVELLNAAGIDAALEDAAEEGFLVGLRTEHDLSFDPAAMIHALLDHPYIDVQTRTEVQDVKPRGDELGIWARKHYALAKAVVLTSGAYVVQLSKLVGRIVHPLAMRMVDLDATPAAAAPLILQGGHVVAWSRESAWRMVTWGDAGEGWQILTHAAHQVCPDAPVLARQSGWVAQSGDGLPVVGELPDLPNVYVISGLGPWGLGWACAAVDHLMALILEGEDPGLLSLHRLVY